MKPSKRVSVGIVCAVLALAGTGCGGRWCYSSCGDSFGYRGHCGGGDDAAIFYGALIGVILIGRLVREIAGGCR
jgi:hypothetical protein